MRRRYARCLGTHLPAAAEMDENVHEDASRRRAGSPVEASCSPRIGQLVASYGLW